MSIPYRHQRILRRLGIVALVLLLIFIVVWFCWVVWLQRYVVYTSSGAKLDFEQSSYDISGVEAAPPQQNVDISIFYNEGADAIDTTKEMTQLDGYYITSDMYKEDLDNIMLQIERLPNSTPIMVDMKGPFGTFFYNSKLGEAIQSQSTNIAGVQQLLFHKKSPHGSNREGYVHQHVWRSCRSFRKTLYRAFFSNFSPITTFQI